MNEAGSAESGGRSTRAWLLAIVLITLLAVLLHAPGLRDGPTLDAAVFTVLADGLRHGELPYRDLWDHKPPGIYALFAAAQAVLPFADAWTAVWLASVAITIGIGVTALRLAAGPRPLLSLAAALVAVFYVAVYPLALGGGQTEPAAALFAMLALVAALARRPLTAGLLCGISVIFSFLAGPAVVGILATVMLDARPAQRVREVTRFVGGTLLIPAVTTAVIIAAGLGASALSAVVSYNGAYSNLNRARPPGAFLYDAYSLVLFVTPLLVLGVPPLLRALRKRWPAVRLGMALWVSVWAALVVVQSRLEPHYAIAALPALVILAASTTPYGSGRGRRDVMAPTAVAAIAVGLAMLGLLGLAARTGVPDKSRVEAVAGALREDAPPNATLFVWGNQPTLYLASGLRPAAPYAYAWPLTTPGYSSAQQAENLVSQLSLTRPAFIVDAGSPAPGEPGIVPLLVHRPVDPGDGRTLDVIDPLRSFVRDHYGPPVEVDGWLLYRATDW